MDMNTQMAIKLNCKESFMFSDLKTYCKLGCFKKNSICNWQILQAKKMKPKIILIYWYYNKEQSIRLSIFLLEISDFRQWFF